MKRLGPADFMMIALRLKGASLDKVAETLASVYHEGVIVGIGDSTKAIEAYFGLDKKGSDSHDC